MTAIYSSTGQFYTWSHTAVNMREQHFAGCGVCGRIEALGEQRPKHWVCVPETSEEILRHALQQR
jgi:hypothetical protein